MKKSILDIGTNSLKFFIYDLNEENKEKKLIFHQKFEKRLGKDFNHETNEINTTSLQNVLEGLQEIKTIAEKYEFPDIIAFGTEAFRKAKNADQVLATIHDQTGITIQVLSPDEELDIYRKGLMKDFNYEGVVATIDIGGGSVQFMRGDKNGLQGKRQYKTGALFLREQFIHGEPPTEAEYNAIEHYIAEQLQDLDITFPAGTPFVHGSSSVIDFFQEAGLELEPFPYSASHPFQVPIEKVEAFYQQTRCLAKEERNKLFPSHP
jgi:exopolyphosphatase/guanosine-5'-triphosphate,3'-diphosphate pyrophosphatase